MDRIETERQMQAADTIRQRQAQNAEEPKGLMERIQELWGNMQKDFQETGLGKALGNVWDFAAHENVVRDIRQKVVEQGWSGQIQTPLMREHPHRHDAGDALGRTVHQPPEAITPTDQEGPMTLEERQDTGSVYQLHRESGHSHVREMDYLAGVSPERHEAPDRESRSGFWEREAAQAREQNMAAANLYLGTPDQTEAPSIER